MARTVAVGLQDFEEIIQNDCFYVDKTSFIKEWWESKDHVTLIARPRRFGKTLNMSMLEQFFSVKYAGRGDLFEGLSIWEDEKYRKLQGTYPVIGLSFANVKAGDYKGALKGVNHAIRGVFSKNRLLLENDFLDEEERGFFQSVAMNMDENTAIYAVQFKVRNAKREATLEDTVAVALKQIEEKRYGAQLIERGIPAEKIRSYGFAFEGKKVLIGSSPAED